MNEIVNSKARGINDAITNADRIFPSNKTTINTTMKHPSKRFSIMVNDVFPINSLRSIIGFI